MTIANSIILADNAYGTIAVSLATGDTGLTFTTGHGARFPAVAAGQVLYCCFLNSTNVLEEIQITAHVNGSDSATIVRGIGGTTAKAWTAGDRIEARISSTVLKRLQDESMKKTTLTTSDSGATYTGAMDVPGLGYVTGLVYPMTLSTSNIGTTPTIALDGLSAITVVLDGGGALAANQLPLNGLYQFDGTNFVILNPRDASWTTGDVKMTLKTTADTGWVLMNDGSLGNAASSATTRANADTAALFALLWNNTVDANCAVSGGRGVSAAADYAANKRISLPKTLGRTLAGYGAGSGLTSRALAATVGEESHALSIGELAVHDHQAPDTGYYNIASGRQVGNVAGTFHSSVSAGDGITSPQTGTAGSGTAHNTMQPTTFVNVMVKL